jgi:hypothetical protein
MTAKLPAEFSDLEPYAERWAHPGEGERFVALVSASIEEARAFYEAIFPRAKAAKTHLEKFDFNALPESEARLMNLLLAFMEMAHVVELNWGETDIDDPFPASRMTFGNTRPASAL